MDTTVVAAIIGVVGAIAAALIGAWAQRRRQPSSDNPLPKMPQNHQAATEETTDQEESQAEQGSSVPFEEVQNESIDPAAELQKMGIPVTEAAFCNAVMRNDASVVGLLVAAGIPVDSLCEAPSEYIGQRSDVTALLAATMRGHIQVAIALTKRGANVNVKADDGSTPLIIASHRGHGNLVFALLEKDVELEAKDSLDETALIKAAETGQVEIVRALIKRGANLNAQDCNGMTALIRASIKYRFHPTEGIADAVRALINTGADLNIEDNERGTALSHARHGPVKRDVVDMLFEAGANR